MGAILALIFYKFTRESDLTDINPLIQTKHRIHQFHVTLRCSIQTGTFVWAFAETTKNNFG